MVQIYNELHITNKSISQKNLNCLINILYFSNEINYYANLIKILCYCNKVAVMLMSIPRKTESTEILLNEFKFDKIAISAVELIKRLNSILVL